MGAWGTGPFQNDDAGDWIAEAIQAGNLSTFHDAFTAVLNKGDEYLEAPEASRCLSAAESLARVIGRGDGDSAENELDEFLRKLGPLRDDSLRQQALSSVNRVITEPSELLELWMESEEFDEWKSGVDDLKRRLSG